MQPPGTTPSSAPPWQDGNTFHHAGAPVHSGAPGTADVSERGTGTADVACRPAHPDRRVGRR